MDQSLGRRSRDMLKFFARGTRIFSKKEEGRFPSEKEIVDKLRERAT